jgi:hypothetical protein
MLVCGAVSVLISADTPANPSFNDAGVDHHAVVQAASRRKVIPPMLDGLPQFVEDMPSAAKVTSSR